MNPTAKQINDQGGKGQAAARTEEEGSRLSAESVQRSSEAWRALHPSEPTAVRESKQPEHTHFCSTSPIAHNPNVSCYCPCHTEQPEPSEVKQPIRISISINEARDTPTRSAVEPLLRSVVEQPAESFHAQALAIVHRHTAKADVDEALVDDIARGMEMASVRSGHVAEPDRESDWRACHNRLVDDIRQLAELIHPGYSGGRTQDEMLDWIRRALSAAQPPIAPDADTCQFFNGTETCGYSRKEHRSLFGHSFVAPDAPIVDAVPYSCGPTRDRPDAPGEQAAPALSAFLRWLLRRGWVDLARFGEDEAGLLEDFYRDRKIEFAAEGAAEKAALLPCPFCEIKDQQRVGDSGGAWVRIEHGDECLIRWNFASGIQFIHQPNWARWNRRASINPASLSAERCAEVLRDIQWLGVGDWVQVYSGEIVQGIYAQNWGRKIDIATAQIITAYHLEHGGLVREEESK